MLDLMRKHAGTWLIKVILGAVIIVFTFWGIGSYRMRKGTRVAIVNGNTITIEQYREAYNRILEQMRQQFGNNLNDEMMKMFNIKQQAMNSLIDQALLLQEAERLDFRVTDEELAAGIRNEPAFQANGRFDTRRYRQVLNMNQLTPESFEAMQRQSMLIGKLRDLVNRSVKVSEAEAKAFYDWRDAAVMIDYVFFDPSRYTEIQPTEEEIQAHYDKNKAAYKTELMKKVRYLKFDPQAYRSEASVSKEDVSLYYEEHPDDYVKPKTVEARHILFRVDENDTPENVAGAKEKAASVLKKIKEGADFAEMAGQYSEGPSKDNGGYLGAFQKEAMLAPFAEKAFSMTAGEVSEPVRTRYGWHIIKVEKINPATTVSLEEASAAIREKLAEDWAKNSAYDAAEAAYEITFETDDLSEVARRLKADLQTTGFFDRRGPAQKVADAPAFADAAFRLKASEISEPTDIQGAYYLIQVVDERPEKVQPLSEVVDRVRAELIEKLQQDRARKDAEDFLDKVSAGTSMAEAGESFDVRPETTDWFKRNDEIPGIGYEPGIAEAVFKADSTHPLPEGVLKGNKGFYVTCFKARKLPDESGFNAQKEPLRQNLLNQKQREAFNALLSDLKAKSEITISEGYRQ